MASKKKKTTQGKDKMSASSHDQLSQGGAQEVLTGPKVNMGMEQGLRSISKTSGLETALEVSS
jgi:hypothetical protein